MGRDIIRFWGGNGSGAGILSCEIRKGWGIVRYKTDRRNEMRLMERNTV